ncbi:MAG: carboxypeptidase-like regulatory domain-containing protein [Flavobacteriales bacterium]|nr:carboxypeptidase-like regulatory domain-containing protein [Flavobacteriales bacterium]
MKKIKYIALLSILFATTLHANCQQKDENLVQFTGMVLSADSLQPLSFTVITIAGTRRGTISDYNGYFTLVAKKGEKLIFELLGYKTSEFVVPDTFQGYKYSLIKLMAQDTFYLDEVVISPLPDRQLFDQYFVKTEVPDTDLERARDNMERQALHDEMLSMDGRENQNYYMQNQVKKFYYAGQMQPMNILSPIAWSEFIKAWKRGDFKRKK